MFPPKTECETQISNSQISDFNVSRHYSALGSAAGFSEGSVDGLSGVSFSVASVFGSAGSFESAFSVAVTASLASDGSFAAGSAGLAASVGAAVARPGAAPVALAGASLFGSITGGRYSVQ